jgi:hypothetical protein
MAAKVLDTLSINGIENYEQAKMVCPIVLMSFCE